MLCFSPILNDESLLILSDGLWKMKAKQIVLEKKHKDGSPLGEFQSRE